MYRPVSVRIVNLLSHTTTTYQFRQGKAILIVGENLDIPSQRGNGAGKSSLNEAISIAIAGKSIRDVKPKELVRNGCERADVELELFNTRTQETLLIKRELYSNNKSSTCRIWVGKNEELKEVTECPDINSYNKWIFDTIGISREDFFSFFLITKEMYDPFFSVGDVRKKQIINRFSGADLVDKTEPFVKEDVEKKQTELTTHNLKVESVKTRIQVLQEQIDVIEQSQSDDKIKEKVIEIESAIFSLKNDIKILEEDVTKKEKLIEEEKEKIRVTNKSIEDLPQVDFETSIKLLETKLNDLKQESTGLEEEYKKVPSLFDDEVTEVRTLDTELQKTLGDTKKLHQALDKQIQELENKIQGAITCPKCSHEFSTRYADFDVESAKIELIQLKVTLLTYETQITETETDIKNLEILKTEINEKIKTQREGISKKQETVEIDRQKTQTELSLEKTKKQQHENKVTELKDEISTFERNISRFQKEIGFNQESKSTLEFSIKTKGEEIEKVKLKDDTQVKNLQKDIKSQEKELTTLEATSEQLQQELSSTQSWLINFKNFKSFLANQSISNITDYTNLFLDLIGSNISIRVEGYRTLSDGRLKEEISTNVLRDGFDEGSYGKFSAGERGRVDLCCILALQELINLSTPSGGLDLLAIDEALDSIGSGLESIVTDLQGLQKTIMIVSQSDLNTSNEDVVLIQKHHKISTIVI